LHYRDNPLNSIQRL